MKISQAGWVVAAGFVGALSGSGFQPKTEKIGVVNITKVYEDSNYKKKLDDKLQATKTARGATLDFMSLNNVFTADQLKQYKDLSLKADPTAADETALTKVKNDVQAATKEFDTLRSKPSPTPADVATLQDYGNRSRMATDARKQWEQEFTNELMNLKDSQDTEAFLAIREAARQVGKSKGYTLIFSERAAVYGASDVSNDVQKAVDKKN